MASQHESGVGAAAAAPAASSTKAVPRPLDADARVAEVRRVGQICKVVVDEVSKVIVGKREVLELVTAGILSEGCHVLFEDMPGLAKSVMASTFSRATGCDFKRVQFTPDLLPADITGTYVFDQRTREFNFHPGPIFTNFLLADEINRASPKTQSALLEAMAEKQVTVEGTTHRLEAPFMVLATQNPIEQEGTYPLPEAQLDRFMMKLQMGYPLEADEAEILSRRIRRGRDAFDVRPVTNSPIVLRMQGAMEHVHVSLPVVNYIAKIITATRHTPQLRAGASPRGSLAVLKMARSWAALQGRAFVTPDDVKRVIIPCLAHRIILSPDARIDGIAPADVVGSIVDGVPAPKSGEYGPGP